MFSEPVLQRAVTQRAVTLNRQRREELSELDDLTGFNLKGYPLYLRQDAYLFREQDPVGNLYGVVEGVLRAERVTGLGLRQILGYFEQGNIIGFAFQSVHHYSIAALTPARLLCFSAASVQEAARAAPRLASRLVGLATRSVSDILDVLALHTHYPAGERLGPYLLALFNRNPLKTMGREILELPTSRRDLAELLGTNVETVARSILALREHGILRVHSARLLELTDRARLESSIRCRRPLACGTEDDVRN